MNCFANSSKIARHTLRIRNVINLAWLWLQINCHSTHTRSHTLIAPCQRPFAIFHYAAHHSLRRLKANAEKWPTQWQREKKPLSTSHELRAVCCLLLLEANSSRFFASTQLLGLCLSVCVCVFSRCVIFGNVFINHTQREPVTPSYRSNVSMWALHFPPAPSDYLPTHSLDISCTCTHVFMQIGKAQIFVQNKYIRRYLHI